MTSQVYDSFSSNDTWDWDAFFIADPPNDSETSGHGQDVWSSASSFENDIVIGESTSHVPLPSDQLALCVPKEEELPAGFDLPLTNESKLWSADPGFKSTTDLETFSDDIALWEPSQELMGLISGDNLAFALSLTNDVYKMANQDASLHVLPVSLLEV